MGTTELETIYDCLKKVEDPELPISIVDLGIVESVQNGADRIEIVLNPTFSGCPALEYIRQMVVDALKDVFSAKQIEVKWSFKSAWTSQKISCEGKTELKKFGIAVAERGYVDCPYCGSRHVVRDSPFGSSLCREIYYCKHCKNPFEKMKHLA